MGVIAALASTTNGEWRNGSRIGDPGFVQHPAFVIRN
jgi:hypothetical protein